MDPVIVSGIGFASAVIGVVVGVGAALAALLRSKLRGIRSELRSLSEGVTAIEHRITGLDRSLSRLEGAFSVAFALPRPRRYGEPSPDRQT